MPKEAIGMRDERRENPVPSLRIGTWQLARESRTFSARKSELGVIHRFRLLGYAKKSADFSTIAARRRAWEMRG